MAGKVISLIKTLPPAEEVQETEYDLRTITAPVLTGLPLRLFISFLGSPLSGPVRSKLFSQNNYPQVGGVLCLWDTYYRSGASSTWRCQAAAKQSLRPVLQATTGLLLCSQILGDLFIPERPTYRPATYGWPAEVERSSFALLTLPEGQAAAERAAAAARVVAPAGW